jgi:hypothetical protein
MKEGSFGLTSKEEFNHKPKEVKNDQSDPSRKEC